MAKGHNRSTYALGPQAFQCHAQLQTGTLLEEIDVNNMQENTSFMTSL